MRLARGSIWTPAVFSRGDTTRRSPICAVWRLREFGRSDAGLLASVRSVAAQLRVAPDAGAVDAQGRASTEAVKGQAVGTAATIERAQNALERTSRFAAAIEGSAR